MKDGQVEWSQIPILDTWRAMEDLVKAGKVKSIGVSNFPIILLHDLLNSAVIPVSVNQVECHPYLAQNRLLSYCQSRGIHVSAYSPLGRPYRTGETAVIHDADIKKLSHQLCMDRTENTENSSSHDYSPASLLLAWNICRSVSVLPKSATPERIKHNYESTLTLVQQLSQTQTHTEKQSTPDSVAPAETVLSGSHVLQAVSKLDRDIRYVNFVMSGPDQGKFKREGTAMFE